jgi:hypothetical protein
LESVLPLQLVGRGNGKTWHISETQLPAGSVGEAEGGCGMELDQFYSYES